MQQFSLLKTDVRSYFLYHTTADHGSNFNQLCMRTITCIHLANFNPCLIEMHFAFSFWQLWKLKFHYF